MEELVTRDLVRRDQNKTRATRGAGSVRGTAFSTTRSVAERRMRGGDNVERFLLAGAHALVLGTQITVRLLQGYTMIRS